MEAAAGIWRGFVKELIPTPLQSLASVFVAACMLTAMQSQQILSGLGISQSAVDSTKGELASRFDVVLQSNITSNIALVTFWAAVGLVAYLVCWGLYNALIAARNEVTIETQYTNRGHWRGVWETLALKSTAALGLIFCIAMFKYGFSLWVALTLPLLAEPGIKGFIFAIGAVLGLAVQLYVLLLFVQLTISPWYKPRAFTE